MWIVRFSASAAQLILQDARLARLVLPMWSHEDSSSGLSFGLIPGFGYVTAFSFSSVTMSRWVLDCVIMLFRSRGSGVLWFTYWSTVAGVWGWSKSWDDTVISASSMSVLGRISVRTDHVQRYMGLSTLTGISVWWVLLSKYLKRRAERPGDRKPLPLNYATSYFYFSSDSWSDCSLGEGSSDKPYQEQRTGKKY